MSKPRLYFVFFFFFFPKNWPGQQALAQRGMHWHTLAHIGKWLVPTQWLPSHWGLPKKLQMTVLSFSAPISLPTPLCFTLLLPSLFYLPLCLSPSLCFFLFHSLSLSPAWSLVIWWRERLNVWLALENTLVTMLCVFLVCVPYHRGIAERESVAGRGANKDRNLKMKLQMRIWSFIWLHQQPQIGESAWWDVR